MTQSFSSSNFVKTCLFLFLGALWLICENGSAESGKTLDHLFVIVMENNSPVQIFGNKEDAPYLNHLAESYGTASHYFGVTHPSLPNYLALISGDFQGIWDDCRAGKEVMCSPREFVPGRTRGPKLLKEQVGAAEKTPHLFEGETLIDQLEAKHISWKGYFQSAPSPGFTGEFFPNDNVDGKEIPRKLYAQKHNPFVYFSSIRGGSGRLNKLVPFHEFVHDLESDQIPRFAWITPDQCHDIHGLEHDNAHAVGIPECSYPERGSIPHKLIQAGDAFIKATIERIQTSKAWSRRSVIAIVWDEDDFSTADGCCGSPQGEGGEVLGGGKIPALFISSRSSTPKTHEKNANHYTFLATIQKLWGLKCLSRSCDIKDEDLLTELF